MRGGEKGVFGLGLKGKDGASIRARAREPNILVRHLCDLAYGSFSFWIYCKHSMPGRGEVGSRTACDRTASAQISLASQLHEEVRTGVKLTARNRLLEVRGQKPR